MIIKGRAAQSVKFWSRHLLRDDTNEKAVLLETRGTLATDLEGALEEMRDVASGSRCEKNFLYQANINPRDNEQLTPSQWSQAIDTLEKNMGFEGHQRAVVEHVKNGRQHVHVIWSRIDPETMKVQDIGGDRYTMRRTANELEQEFGLSRTAATFAERGDKPADRPLEMWELDRAERSKIDPKAMKAEFTELWRETETGSAFKAAIEDRGYVLARGDRRGLVVMDHAGDVHSLARRIDGVKAAEVNARFSEGERDALPNVAEARETQRGRQTNAEQKFDPDYAARAWETRLTDVPIGQDADRETEPGLCNASVEEKEPVATGNETDEIAFEPTHADGAHHEDALHRDKDEGREGEESREGHKGEDVRESSLSLVEAKSITDTAPRTASTALMVADMAGMVIGTVAELIVDLFEGWGKQPVKPPSPRDEIIAERRRALAIERMGECLEKKEPLRGSDVLALKPAELRDIAQNGDGRLRDLIENQNREERDRGSGLER